MEKIPEHYIPIPYEQLISSRDNRTAYVIGNAIESRTSTEEKKLLLFQLPSHVSIEDFPEKAKLQLTSKGSISTPMTIDIKSSASSNLPAALSSCTKYTLQTLETDLDSFCLSMPKRNDMSATVLQKDPTLLPDVILSLTAEVSCSLTASDQSCAWSFETLQKDFDAFHGRKYPLNGAPLQPTGLKWRCFPPGTALNIH
jgi:hypothetical protein